MRDLSVRRYPRPGRLPRVAALPRYHLRQHRERCKARGLLVPVVVRVLFLVAPSLADANRRAPRANVASVPALALRVEGRRRRLC